MGQRPEHGEGHVTPTGGRHPQPRDAGTAAPQNDRPKQTGSRTAGDGDEVSDPYERLDQRHDSHGQDGTQGLKSTDHGHSGQDKTPPGHGQTTQDRTPFAHGQTGQDSTPFGHGQTSQDKSPPAQGQTGQDSTPHPRTDFHTSLIGSRDTSSHGSQDHSKSHSDGGTGGYRP